MTDYSWQTIRTNAIQRFGGQTPGQQAEAQIIDVFNLAPNIVTRAIDDTAELYAQGKVHSPWGFVTKRLEGATTTTDITATDHQEREHAVKQAERYVVNAGYHYDTWTDELEDELFGDRGRLQQWADDPGLRDRLHRLWLEHRPRGVEAEAQQNTDAERHREQRATAILERERRQREGEETSAEYLQRLIDEQNAESSDDLTEPF